MKLKIKVREIVEGCMPVIYPVGVWIDLRAADTIELKTPCRRTAGNNVVYIPLGVAMELPKGYEALVLPRSSTPKNFKIICANSAGIIDNDYKGNEDEWKFPAIALANTTIEKGNRICQFRIQLSQKATIWQKIKWLLSNGIKLVKVDELSNVNRAGLGSTGIN